MAGYALATIGFKRVSNCGLVLGFSTERYFGHLPSLSGNVRVSYGPNDSLAPGVVSVW